MSDALTEAATDPTEAATLTGEDEPERKVVLSRGSQVGRYLILERVGRGGMGVVYSAFDPDLDRRVALKLMLPSYRGRHELAAEARALAKLDHRNVVGVHDVGTWQGRMFFAMELVEGVDLAAWLAERARSLAETLDVFIQAARGLAAAHDAGLSHGDFKPGNVLIGADGVVRVADFGLARPSDDDDGSADGTLRLVGTPRYMAPEQLRGRRATPASDQFALCVSLYEALNGSPPFPGSDPASLCCAIFEDGHVPGRPAPATNAVWNVLERGLSIDATQRLPDMHAVADALAAATVHRQRWWIGAGAFTALATAAAGLAYQRGAADSARVCDDGPARLAEVWNGERRDRLRAHLGHANPDYGSTIAKTVVNVFDEFAETWPAEYRSACLATADVPSREDLIHAACIEDRLESLANTILWVENIDDKTVAHAAQTATWLATTETCDRSPALLPHDEPPADPALRLEVRALQRALTRAHFLATAQDRDESAALLSEVRARVEATGYRPLMSSWALYQAREDNWSDRRDAAYDGMRNALNLALGAASYSHAMFAATELMDFDATRSRLREAEHWMALGTALLNHLDESEPSVFTFRNNQAILFTRLGRYADAAAIWEKLAARSPQTLAIYANLARVELGARRLEEAQRWAETYSQRCDELLGAAHPECRNSALVRGTVAAAAGDYPLAVQLVASRLEPILSGRVAATLLDANAMHVLAVARSYTGDRAGALALAQRTVDLIRRVEPEWAELAPKQESLARLLMLSGRYDDARAVYLRYVAREPRPERVLLGFAGAAACSLKLGAILEARDALREAQAKADSEDTEVYAFVHSVRGRIELAVGDPEAALRSFEQMEAASGPRDAEGLIEYAKLLAERGEPGRARQVLQPFADDADDFGNVPEQVQTAMELRDRWAD